MRPPIILDPLVHAAMFNPTEKFDLKRAQDRVYRQIADATRLEPATAAEIVARVNQKWFADYPAASINAFHVNWAARRGYIKRMAGRPPRFFVDKLVPYS